jgi:F-type H+-transporting ATPase subunit b
MNRDALNALVAGAAWAMPAFAMQDDHQPAGDTHEAGADTHDTHGAGHEEVGAIPTAKQGLATGITALVVFAIVFFILAAKVWPKISKGLDERAGKIREEIAAAEEARRQAAAALESYQQNLAEARAEAQKMLEEARAQQQALAADLKAKADAELNEMRDKARRDIETAKRAAINEIYAESVNRATEMAAKILAREVKPSDHQRLVDQSLAELQGATS